MKADNVHYLFKSRSPRVSELFTIVHCTPLVWDCVMDNHVLLLQLLNDYQQYFSWSYNITEQTEQNQLHYQVSLHFTFEKV